MMLESGTFDFLSDTDLIGYGLKEAFDISCIFIRPANQGRIDRISEAMRKKERVIFVEIFNCGYPREQLFSTFLKQYRGEILRSGKGEA